MEDILETFDSIWDEITEYQEKTFADIDTSISSNNYKFHYPIVSNLLRKFESLIHFFDMRDVYKAEGLWQDKLYSNFNLIRKQASYATTTWTTKDSEVGTFIDAGELTVKNSAGTTFTNKESGTVGEDYSLTLSMICNTKGSIGNVSAGELHTIVNPISGINTGYNYSNVTNGQDKENDLEFRERFLSGRSGVSYWNVNGITRTLLALDGVSSAIVIENDTAATVNDLPPHSIHVVVYGGDEDEIAKVIFERTDPGIQKYGAISKKIADINGNYRTVKFSRPTNVNIHFKLTCEGLTDLTDMILYIKGYLDDSAVSSTLNTFQRIRYLEENLDLSTVTLLDMYFKREEDSVWATTVTLEDTEKAVGVRYVE